MLDKPDIEDAVIVAAVGDGFGLKIVQVMFLPLGADFDTAVYRAVAADGTAYFLKLRRGNFDEVAVAIPRFLQTQGIAAVMNIACRYKGVAIVPCSQIQRISFIVIAIAIQPMVNEQVTRVTKEIVKQVYDIGVVAAIGIVVDELCNCFTRTIRKPGGIVS